jgi:hypothetical protein
MQVYQLPFVPPEKDIIDMLRVRAEILGKLICSAWGGKCRQILKYVSYLSLINDRIIK